MSTTVQFPDTFVSAGVLSTAVIGPDDQRRNAVIEALTESQNGQIREFIGYPASIADAENVITVRLGVAARAPRQYERPRGTGALPGQDLCQFRFSYLRSRLPPRGHRSQHCREVRRIIHTPRRVVERAGAGAPPGFPASRQPRPPSALKLMQCNPAMTPSRL